MRRVTVYLFAVLLLTGVGAAQTQLDEGPGLVTPDSALYGLEVAWDNAGMALRMKSPGSVAQERAAEARQMQEEGNHEAAERAAREFSSVAERAQADDMEGLEKAQAVLQEVMANAPAEAQEGLQTALDSVQQARQRTQQQDGQANDTETGDQAPDSGSPNETPNGQP